MPIVPQQYLRSSFGKEPTADAGPRGPPWLQVDLPVIEATIPGASSTAGEPVWTLGLDMPLPNVFYDAMIQFAASQPSTSKMLEYYNGELQQNHALIMGASGCGKTALGLSLAERNFLLLLEIPGPQSGGKEPTGGYRMIAYDWRKGFANEEAIHATLFAEVSARLLVLRHLLEEHPEMTPMQWLLFCFSDQGSERIEKACDQVSFLFPRGVQLGLVNELQVLINKLPTVKSRYPTRLPLILMVDELQELFHCWAPPPGINDRRNAMEAVVFAAQSFKFPAVWSGTRVGVTAGKSDISGIAKQYTGQVKMHAVCDFDYIKEETVRSLLTTVLHLSELHVSGETLRQLQYLLQGRARVLVSFVDKLLDRKRYAGGEWPEMLTDAILMCAVKDLYTDMVLPRYTNEITRICGLDRGDGFGWSDVGEIWAFNMLCAREESIKGGAVGRKHSLSFTRSLTAEVKNASGKVEHHFDNQFGEPGLQEALQMFVCTPDAMRNQVARLGIDAFLRNQGNASGQLGAAWDKALALAFLYRRDDLLKRMLERQHRSLNKYQNYELTVKRVVEVNTKQQLEWFQLVNADLMDTTFSLAPGIAVRDIVILPNEGSGAGLICVATPPRTKSDSSTGALLFIYFLIFIFYFFIYFLTFIFFYCLFQWEKILYDKTDVC